MTTYKPPDYLGKARELRARRLGVPAAPARSIHPGDNTKARGTGSSTPTVKATRKHALITTSDHLAELMASLEDVSRVALDLETTGLDPRQDRVRLLTLATEQGTWLVDCFQVDPHPLFSALAQKKLLIHNALFDLGFLFAMGFEPGEDGEVIDTMLLSQLLYGQHPQIKEDT